MNNQKAMIELIKEISGQANVLTIPKIFIRLTGDIKCALFLSQCVYWSDRGRRKDGFFYKTIKEWKDEIGLSRFETERAREFLKELKVLEYENHLANGAPTTHYRIDIETLAARISDLLESDKSDLLESDKSDLLESDKSDLLETSKSLTETTIELIKKESSGEDKKREKANPSELSFSQTPGGEKLRQALAENARAKGRRGPNGFPSIECRDNWLAFEKRLPPDVLEQAIHAGLAAGITAVPRIVSYVGGWAKKYVPPARPAPQPSRPQQVQEPGPLPDFVPSVPRPDIAARLAAVIERNKQRKAEIE